MADATGLIHATILSVTAEYSPSRPFEAMAQSRLGPIRVFLEERPLTPIKPGDELIFRPVQVNSNSNDGVLEVMPQRDALSSALTTFAGDDITVYRSANVNPKPTINFGVADALKWAKAKSMASTLTRKTGVTIISRPDAATHGDPVIKWVSKRFEQPSLAGLKGVCDLIVQPGAITAARSEFQRDRYRNDPHAMIAAALLPAYLQHDAPAEDPLVQTVIRDRARHVGLPAGAHRNNVGVVYPYALTQTGMGHAIAISGWSPDGALPKHLIGARSRFMLMAAHEMAHSLHLDFKEMLPGHIPASESAITQLGEAFADSLAILIYLNDGGTADDAQRYADLRSIAAIAIKAPSHMTGRACHAAIAAGSEINQAGGFKSIETIQLVETALSIAMENYTAPAEDYRLLQEALSTRAPGWRFESAAEIAALVPEAVRSIGSKLQSPAIVMADARAAVMGLSKSYHMGLVNQPEICRKRLAVVASLDLENHVEECLIITSRAATAQALEVIEAEHRVNEQLFGNALSACERHSNSRETNATRRALLQLRREYYATIADMTKSTIDKYRYRLSTQMTGARLPFYVATRRSGEPLMASQTAVEPF